MHRMGISSCWGGLRVCVWRASCSKRPAAMSATYWRRCWPQTCAPRSSTRRACAPSREGTHQLAKTDRIDAKVLARYGAYMRPSPAVLPSSARATLKEMIAYRAQITQEMTARTSQLRLYESASVRARAEAAHHRPAGRADQDRERDQGSHRRTPGAVASLQDPRLRPRCRPPRRRHPHRRSARARLPLPSSDRRPRRACAFPARFRRAARLSCHPRRPRRGPLRPLQRGPRHATRSRGPKISEPTRT